MESRPQNQVNAENNLSTFRGGTGENREERGRLNDGFYSMLMPRPRHDLMSYSQACPEDIFLEEEPIEKETNKEIIPLKFQETRTPNVSTAVAPFIFADSQKYNPLFCFLNVILPRKQPGQSLLASFCTFQKHAASFSLASRADEQRHQ